MVAPSEYVFEEQSDASSAVRGPRSLLGIVVLGLLIQRPSHGYEIAQRLEKNFAFLRPKKAAVYSTMESLAEAGLIERALGASRGLRGNAKTYRATADGARAYRIYLAEKVHADPQRMEMLGLMTLAGASTIDAALEFVEHYEAECFRDAKALGGSDFREPDASGGTVALIGRLLLEEQRQMIEAKLAWCSYAKAELRAQAQQSGDGGEQL